MKKFCDNPNCVVGITVWGEFNAEVKGERK
jgi:hypothetical protein